MKKITIIELPAELAKEAKELAAKRRTTLQEMIVEIVAEDVRKEGGK